MSFLVEVCCYSIEDVTRARRAGARRVEVCADPFAGGVTPSFGLIKKIRTMDIDIAMMIRPRGGDFVYTLAEQKVMEEDILQGAKLGVKAVVFGILTKEGTVDEEAMEPLVSLAHRENLEVTFHRAFDVISDPNKALQSLLRLQVDRILTSGQRKTAVLGLPLLCALQKEARDRLILMPGGGIRSSNAREILACGFSEIHTGATKMEPSEMQWFHPEVKMGRTGYTDAMHMYIDEEDVGSLVALTREDGCSWKS